MLRFPADSRLARNPNLDFEIGSTQLKSKMASRLSDFQERLKWAMWLRLSIIYRERIWNTGFARCEQSNLENMEKQ